MVKLNPCVVASYLAQLYEATGHKETVLPSDFTKAICNICDGDFVDTSVGWLHDWEKKVVTEEWAKERAVSFELLPNTKHDFRDVANYVKWDLIHQKLIELNKAEAA
jgi:hypothetical protein